jgi:hypothetical protein
MKEKFGIALTWALYLGTVRVVGPEVLPFLLYVLVLGLVLSLLMGHLMRPTMRSKGCE